MIRLSKDKADRRLMPMFQSGKNGFISSSFADAIIIWLTVMEYLYRR